MIAAWAAAARQQILRRDVFAAEAARGAAAAAENASRRLFAALHNRCSVFNANATAVDSGGATTTRWAAGRCAVGHTSRRNSNQNPVVFRVRRECGITANSQLQQPLKQKQRWFTKCYNSSAKEAQRPAGP
jgi:hypothetical protein